MDAERVQQRRDYNSQEPPRLPGHVTAGPAGAVGRCRGRTRSPKTRASGRRAGVAAAHSERHGESREDGWKRSSVCAGASWGPGLGGGGVPAGSSAHRAIEPAEGSSRPSGLGASRVLVPGGRPRGRSGCEHLLGRSRAGGAVGDVQGPPLPWTL